MPEGDSIWLAAHRLRPRLVGETLQQVYSNVSANAGCLQGQQVIAIATHGKHLRIDCSNDFSARVHLRMRGRWRFVSRAPLLRDSLYLRTEKSTCICIHCQDVEIASTVVLRRKMAQLGPDILAASFSPSECATAMIDRFPRESIGTLLLDQRVVSGIGNVYKSEGLFVSRLNPWRPVGQLGQERVQSLLATIRALMRANLRPGWRKTTDADTSDRYHVYRRAGRPCFVCGDAIVSKSQTFTGRTTYYCPTCQCNK